MDSRELGLLLAQQLFKVEDLHYGWWEAGETPTMSALPAAQQRYNDILLERLSVAPRGARVLDVGCGVGRLVALLSERGYRADGVNPSATMCRMIRERLDAQGHQSARVFQCKFEDFPVGEHAHAYDAIVFSESFQYIPMNQSLALVQRLLKPGGTLVICDFFKTAAHGDGGPGDGTFGGGHPLAAFAPALAAAKLDVVEHVDITRHMSPNLALVNDLLMNRAVPASRSIGTYLDARYPKSFKLLKWLMRKKIDKAQRKYLSGHRSPEVFERYKSYRLAVCRMGAAALTQASADAAAAATSDRE